MPGGDVQVSGLLCACSASAVGGGCQPHTLRARVMLPRAAGCLCRKMAPGLVGAASPLVWAACSASRHAPLPGRTQDPRRLCWGIVDPRGQGGAGRGSRKLGGRQFSTWEASAWTESQRTAPAVHRALEPGRGKTGRCAFSDTATRARETWSSSRWARRGS